jgi:hypothetical protein
MKSSFLILALLATTCIVYAQPQIEYSQPIDVSSSGAHKILQLKNGNTFLLHFSKQGIDVSVYDKKRDVIARANLTSDLWDASAMPYSSLEGLYEISGQPVIFLSQSIGKDYCLFRIILDPQTGKILNEKKLSHFAVRGRFNFLYGATSENTGGFVVEKDPYSDYYAVAYYNNDPDDIDEAIRVVHYNGENKKIGAGYLTLPRGKYKYINFIALAVIGDKQVNICTYAYNSKRDKGEDAKVIISKLAAGDSVFENKELDFTEDFRNTQAIMKYNKGTGMLNLLTLTRIKSKGSTTYYLALVNYIDPSTLYVTGTVPLTAEKASAFMQAHLDVDAYQGLPQDMIINPDNSITVLMEENQQEIITNRYSTSYRTYLGNIGITVMDPKGKEKEGAAILKMQYAALLINPLYMHYKHEGMWSYNPNAAFRKNYNAFLSFDYVSTNNNRYVMFNDLPENFDRNEKKKRKILTYPDQSNTICYKLNKGDMEKFYLFGEPADSRDNTFCNIESSDYLAETNTYCTMIVADHKHDQEIKLAWVKFD